MARSTRVMFAAGRVPARIRAVEPNVDLVLRVAFEVLLVGLVLWWWIFLGLHTGSASWGFDFRQFWQGGNDVVNGISPYPSPALLATAGDHLDALGIREVFRFPYPAGAAVALAPFGALSFAVAVAVWGAVLVTSLVAAIWILGVRDWRVVAIVLSSAPVLSAAYLGTLTPLLIFLLAVAWRWRDSRWIVSGSLAAAIALKLFLWPLVVWLAATKRWVEALVACVLAVAVTLVAWAAIGFEGLAHYPELVRRLSDVVADRGFSLVALAAETGLDESVAAALPWFVGVALLAWMTVASRGAEGDRIAFSIAIVAALALTPIVWLHYFALLIVPLAIARPKLSWVWALMWAFWIIPDQGNGGDAWRVIVAVGLVSVAAAVSAAGRPMLRLHTNGRATRKRPSARATEAHPVTSSTLSDGPTTGSTLPLRRASAESDAGDMRGQ